MPNPRVSDAVKRRRGTYRADRAEDADLTEPENEALTEYKQAAKAALGRALHGQKVVSDIAYLCEAENALAQNGIVTSDGTPWHFSTLVKIAQR